MLRTTRRFKDCVLVAHADASLIDGTALEFTLYDEGSEPKRLGIRIQIKGSSTRHPSYVALEIGVDGIEDFPMNKDGPGLPGNYDRIARPVVHESHPIPFGGALVAHQPIGKDKNYCILIRVMSLEAAR